MIKAPKRLRSRPQWRGLPIPYIALIGDDGKPDFRVTDEAKRRSVILNHWCQLCGQPLGKVFFFTGGTEAAKANAFFEPACHMDCLIYAMQVCPFIVGRIEHADLDKVASAHPHMTVQADDTFATKRNPQWQIVKADGWRAVKSRDGTLLLRPDVLKVTPPMKPEEMTPADWRKVERFLL
jgi:hypothetical protein